MLGGRRQEVLSGSDRNFRRSKVRSVCVSFCARKWRFESTYAFEMRYEFPQCILARQCEVSAIGANGRS